MMAIERKAYSCEFRCGGRTVLSKKAMERHESICFKNPKVRACNSCAHFEKEVDNNGMEGTPYFEAWKNWVCNAEDETLQTLQSNCDKYERKIK